MKNKNEELNKKNAKNQLEDKFSEKKELAMSKNLFTVSNKDIYKILESYDDMKKQNEKISMQNFEIETRVFFFFFYLK